MTSSDETVRVYRRVQSTEEFVLSISNNDRVSCLPTGDDDIPSPYPKSELWAAVTVSDESAVASLLSAGADPNGVTEERSILEEAIIRGHVGIVNFLLAAGANPNRPGPRGLTPMMFASDEFEIVRALLDAGGDFDGVDHDGWCVLAHVAYSISEPLLGYCQRSSRQILDLLLQRGADPTKGAAAGVTPLGLLLARNPCSAEAEDAALALLSEGADPNARFDHPWCAFNRVWTMLSLAAFHGSPSIVQALLANGADPNLSHGFGLAPLNLALERGDQEIVSLLKAAGATIPMEVDDDLESAVAWGNESSVARLLPLARLDCASASQLLLLSIERWGRGEIVRGLIEFGADPNTPGGYPDDPSSALSLAVSASREEAVRVLLDEGASPERLSESSTLMTKAAELGDIGVLGALINYGIAVDVPDHEAWTPLMEACNCNQLAAVRFLISQGANVNAATLNNQPDYLGGATPLITAAKNEEGGFNYPGRSSR